MNLVILRIFTSVVLYGRSYLMQICYPSSKPWFIHLTFLLKKLGLDVDFYLSSSFDLTDVSKEFLYQSSILSRLCVAKCVVFFPLASASFFFSSIIMQTILWNFLESVFDFLIFTKSVVKNKYLSKFYGYLITFPSHLKKLHSIVTEILDDQGLSI